MIAKEAKNIHNSIRNRMFFDSARSAFFALLKAVTRPPQDVVLMPAYIGESVREGSGVFDPVRALGLRCVFYNLRPDLQTDLEDFKQKLSLPGVRAALLIHYFGFPQKDVKRIKQWCAKRGVLLIEDCAHALDSRLEDVPLGSFGDFALFSIHKILPSKAGGILQLNTPAAVENAFPADIADLSVFCNAQMDKISTRRRENYVLYLERFNKNSSLYRPFFPELPPQTVPLNFPVLITRGTRENLYDRLLKKGIVTVALWYKLIAELAPEHYPMAHEISRRILNLPVHQDTEPADVAFILDALEELDREN